MIDNETREEWRKIAQAEIDGLPYFGVESDYLAKAVLRLLEEVDRLDRARGMHPYRFPKYENDPAQLNKATATMWAVHMNVRPDALHAALERMAELRDSRPALTGEYGYGDSWTEWGEPPRGPDDGHLTVYYQATPDTAYAFGDYISIHIAFAARRIGEAGFAETTFAVSTAGDFAEQVNP